MIFRHTPILRIVAALLVVTFIASDVAWAYPDLRGPAHPSDTLAPSTSFNDKAFPHKALLGVLEQYIENGVIARDLLTIDLIGEILAAHSEEEWFKKNIAYATFHGEALIQFAPETVLRYFDPAISAEDKYPASAVALSGVGLAKQLLTGDAAERAIEAIARHKARQDRPGGPGPGTLAERYSEDTRAAEAKKIADDTDHTARSVVAKAVSFVAGMRRSISGAIESFSLADALASYAVPAVIASAVFLGVYLVTGGCDPDGTVVAPFMIGICDRMWYREKLAEERERRDRERERREREEKEKEERADELEKDIEKSVEEMGELLDAGRLMDIKAAWVGGDRLIDASGVLGASTPSPSGRRQTVGQLKALPVLFELRQATKEGDTDSSSLLTSSQLTGADIFDESCLEKIAEIIWPGEVVASIYVAFERGENDAYMNETRVRLEFADGQDMWVFSSQDYRELNSPADLKELFTRGNFRRGGTFATSRAPLTAFQTAALLGAGAASTTPSDALDALCGDMKPFFDAAQGMERAAAYALLARAYIAEGRRDDARALLQAAKETKLEVSTAVRRSFVRSFLIPAYAELGDNAQRDSLIAQGEESLERASFTDEVGMDPVGSLLDAIRRINHNNILDALQTGTELDKLEGAVDNIRWLAENSRDEPLLRAMEARYLIAILSEPAMRQDADSARKADIERSLHLAVLERGLRGADLSEAERVIDRTILAEAEAAAGLFGFASSLYGEAAADVERMRAAGEDVTALAGRVAIAGATIMMYAARAGNAPSEARPFLTDKELVREANSIERLRAIIVPVTRDRSEMLGGAVVSREDAPTVYLRAGDILDDRRLESVVSKLMRGEIITGMRVEYVRNLVFTEGDSVTVLAELADGRDMVICEALVTKEMFDEKPVTDPAGLRSIIDGGAIRRGELRPGGREVLGPGEIRKLIMPDAGGGIDKSGSADSAGGLRKGKKSTRRDSGYALLSIIAPIGALAALYPAFAGQPAITFILFTLGFTVWAQSRKNRAASLTRHYRDYTPRHTFADYFPSGGDAAQAAARELFIDDLSAYIAQYDGSLWGTVAAPRLGGYRRVPIGQLYDIYCELSYFGNREVELGHFRSSANARLDSTYRLGVGEEGMDRLTRHALLFLRIAGVRARRGRAAATAAQAGVAVPPREAVGRGWSLDAVSAFRTNDLARITTLKTIEIGTDDQAADLSMVVATMVTAIAAQNGLRKAECESLAQAARKIALNMIATGSRGVIVINKVEQSWDGAFFIEVAGHDRGPGIEDPRTLRRFGIRGAPAPALAVSGAGYNDRCRWSIESAGPDGAKGRVWVKDGTDDFVDHGPSDVPAGVLVSVAMPRISIEPAQNAMTERPGSALAALKNALRSSTGYREAAAKGSPVFVSGVPDAIARFYTEDIRMRDPRGGKIGVYRFEELMAMYVDAGPVAVAKALTNYEAVYVYGYEPSRSNGAWTAEDALDLLGSLRDGRYRGGDAIRLTVFSPEKFDHGTYSRAQRLRWYYPLIRSFAFMHLTGERVVSYRPERRDTDSIRFPTGKKTAAGDLGAGFLGLIVPVGVVSTIAVCVASPLVGGAVVALGAGICVALGVVVKMGADRKRVGAVRSLRRPTGDSRPPRDDGAGNDDILGVRPQNDANVNAGEIASSATCESDRPPRNDEMKAMMAELDTLFRETQITGNEKILMSESLFAPEDVVALKCVIDQARVEILPAKEIRNRAINANGGLTRATLGCIVTREEFNALWKGSHQQYNKATVVALEDDLKGERYLYVQGVVGFARALMNNDRSRIAAYTKLLFGVAITDELLAALAKDNPIEFAVKAILRFRPIVPIDPATLEDLKKAADSLLASA